MADRRAIEIAIQRRKRERAAAEAVEEPDVVPEDEVDADDYAYDDEPEDEGDAEA